jgi:hypothetical protein
MTHDDATDKDVRDAGRQGLTAGGDAAVDGPDRVSTDDVGAAAQSAGPSQQVEVNAATEAGRSKAALRAIADAVQAGDVDLQILDGFAGRG